MTAAASPATTALAMAIDPAAGLVSAAAYLTSAADDLRAIGLLMFAEEIDALIATLDAEISLGMFARGDAPPGS